MDGRFFERPILNSPYACPLRHWELDEHGQPTQRIVEARRSAQFITPIPKPRKSRRAAAQASLVLNEGAGISTAAQQYDPTPVINELRHRVDQWRAIPNSNAWGVTPETARLLQHWRHHEFTGVRPFFCQIEAVETAIWLTEVAPNDRHGKAFLEHLANANREANPVAVMACDDEVVPLQSRIQAIADEGDLEDAYETERHLLYVACTRTRDHLLVTGVEPASEFLDDLRGDGARGAGRR